jgi:hypothetical protein
MILKYLSNYEDLNIIGVKANIGPLHFIKNE